MYISVLKALENLNVCPSNTGITSVHNETLNLEQIQWTLVATIAFVSKYVALKIHLHP